MSSYRTIAKTGTSNFKSKGSKHFGFAYNVKNEDEIKALLEALRTEHSSANHVCYAWRLGVEKDRERANDDGEPANSAGKPILGSIERHDLTNTLVAVVRYFGGTKLGVGGLIEAYRTASNEAILNARIITKKLRDYTELQFEYDKMSVVMQIIRQHKIKVVERELEASCRLVIASLPENTPEILQILEGFPDIRSRYLETV